MAGVMATMWTTRSSPFEPRTATPAASIIRTAAAAAIVAATIASTAPIGALETRSRIAADARGVPRKIFACATVGRARFSGQKNRVICRRRFGNRFGGASFQRLAFDYFTGTRFADRGRVDRAFVRGIGFRFGEGVSLRGIVFFRFLVSFRRGVFSLFPFGMNFFVKLRGFFSGFFRFVLVVFFFLEISAAHQGIRRGVRLRLFVFGFDEARRNYSDIVVAERAVWPGAFGVRQVRSRRGRIGNSGRDIVRGCGNFFRSRRGGVRLIAGFRQEPAWQSPGRASRRTGRGST
jgi:hypothetical protein